MRNVQQITTELLHQNSIETREEPLSEKVGTNIFLLLLGTSENELDQDSKPRTRTLIYIEFQLAH
jgi:hypothetical protein